MSRPHSLCFLFLYGLRPQRIGKGKVRKRVQTEPRQIPSSIDGCSLETTTLGPDIFYPDEVTQARHGNQAGNLIDRKTRILENAFGPVTS